MKRAEIAGIKEVALSTKISMTIPSNESELPLKLSIEVNNKFRRHGAFIINHYRPSL